MPAQPENRVLRLNRARAREAERLIPCSVSSEARVRRPWGIEILDHNPGSVDLSRAVDGKLPLLCLHDPFEMPRPGNVEGLRISGRKLRGFLRFAASERGQQLYDAVMDGTAGELSIGYFPGTAREEGTDPETGLPVFRVMRWQPFEVSLLNVPADVAVGARREALSGGIMPRDSEGYPLSPEPRHSPPLPERRQAAIQVQDRASDSGGSDSLPRDERTRDNNQILALGRAFEDQGLLALAHEYVRGGRSLADFRQDAAVAIGGHQGQPFRPVMEFDPVGLGREGHDKFSVLRAIRAMATHDFRDAGYEREVSDTLKRTAGRDTEGMFIPLGAIMPRSRSMNIGDPSHGGSLVAEQRLEEEFIDVLRPVSIAVAAGARVLPGLKGNVSIAKRSSSTGGFWVGDDDDLTESNWGTGEVSLNPHTCGGLVKVTRKLMMQTGGAAESLTRADIAEILGTEIDKVAINGLGSSGQPMGILKTTGIGSVSVGNTIPDWEKITSFIGSLGAVNAMTGQLAWATTPQVHARLLAEPKDPGSGQFVWEPAPQGSVAQGMIAGYPAFASNNVPSNLGLGANRHALIYGNWADLLIGTWSSIELMIDPYTNFKSGAIWVRGFVDLDLALRHVQAMCAAQDIDPTVP